MLPSRSVSSDTLPLCIPSFSSFYPLYCLCTLEYAVHGSRKPKTTSENAPNATGLVTNFHAKKHYVAGLLQLSTSRWVPRITGANVFAIIQSALQLHQKTERKLVNLCCISTFFYSQNISPIIFRLLFYFLSQVDSSEQAEHQNFQEEQNNAAE